MNTSAEVRFRALMVIFVIIASLTVLALYYPDILN